jgi:hypothetical protein
MVNYIMKRKIISLLYVLLVTLPFTASAADLMTPGMGQAWLSSQGADVQDVLTWLLAGLVVAVVVAFVLFSGIAGIKIMSNSGNMGNPQEKSGGQTAILNVLIGLVAVVLFIKIGLKFFGWF